jgi:flagellin-like protein
MHRKAKKLSTKFKRSIRAISPIIATLLMIAIAVVASLVAYAWVMGYIGGTTTKTGNLIEIPSYSRATGQWLIIYVQNVGQGTVQLKNDGAVFINDIIHIITSSEPAINPSDGRITIPVGVTAKLTTDFWYTGQQITIKVVTADGTFMQTTGRESDIPGSTSTFDISVGWSGDGSIVPHGPLVTVNPGATQSFTIVPGSNSRIQDVSVDGLPQGIIVSRTFSNIDSDHAIFATFQLNAAGTHTIIATSGPNGVINPSGQVTVQDGTNQAFTFNANAGYHVSSVIVDGVSQPIASPYTFNSVNANHRIAVAFEADTGSGQTHTITASATAGGTITPSGAVTVNNGQNQIFQMTANSGFHIADVRVDGASVGTPNSFTFVAVTADHTINVIFESDAVTPPSGPYTITATAGPHGIIAPSGIISVPGGSNQAFTITAESGYHIADVFVDAISMGATNSYTFTSVVAPHVIFATFASNAQQPSYIIVASAGLNGLISPSGQVSVTSGGSQTFTMTPNSGFHIANVIVDGNSEGNVASYTFTNVNDNHVISVTFYADTPGKYTITASAGANGQIAPSGQITVTAGGSQTFNFIPNTGYHIGSVVVDGTPLPAPQSPSYTFNNVNAGHSIVVAFDIDVHNIAASAGAGGQITPSGQVLVNYGADKAFTITPNSGYHISSVSVDGTSIGAVLSYTFTNIDSDHTISASFAQNAAGAHTILANAGPNGVISPSGQVNVANGASQVFQIQPNSGYHIDSITVDGNPVQNPQPTYTFTNVIADHTINAAFAADPAPTHTITVTATTNGQITPGTGTVAHGTDKTYTITANPGYAVSDVIIDGNPLGSMISYTFVNVVSDHTIGATFTQITGSHHVIHSSAGANGQITPEGDVIVNDGSDQTFNIVTDLHYHIASVTVDGASAGISNSYTFHNVRADHTITVTFAINTNTITASANANGQISPTGSIQVNYGADQTFTITPNTGYRVSNVVVDGTSVGSQTSYTFTTVITSHTITASFTSIQLGTHIIQASTGGHGTITPSGSVAVNDGADQAFAIVAESHYHVATLVVDGTPIGARTSYTFTNVISDHTIAVTFAIDTVTITATAGANGQITPVGAVAVPYGSNPLFTITPNAGYVVASLTIDGTFAGYGKSYTFTNVVASHTIAVTFTQGTTLIETGFDGSPWDASWQAGGNPPWYGAIGQGIGGSTAAKSDPVGSNDGPFTSDMMNTQGKNTIRITFMYMVLNTNDPHDLRLAYSYNSATPNLDPDSPNFHYVAEIGTTPAQDSVWYVGSLTITRTATSGAVQDAAAFSQYFYFRFESSLNGSGGSAEQTWVDNVVITMSP